MRKKSLLVIIFIILIILGHYAGWLNSIENFFRRIINPGVYKAYNWSVEVGNATEKFKTVQELEDAYKKIKEKYNIALVDNVNFKLLEQENKDLRKQLNFLEKTNYTLLGAFVIGKNTDSLRNSIVINRGEKDGVKVGLSVIADNGILVGKIIKVNDITSMVQLVNDQQSKIAATIMNKDKSIGIVEGGYGLSIQMNFIPQNESILVGDIVITSGLEKEIPNGLVIGTVDSVEKEAYQPFQKATISPLINLEKIRAVSIIIDSKKTI